MQCSVGLRTESRSRHFLRYGTTLDRATSGLVIAQWTPKQAWGVRERDAYYSSISWDGWGGASGRPHKNLPFPFACSHPIMRRWGCGWAGHDAVIIAYDALLGAKSSWHELAYRGILHGGDNDTTGPLLFLLLGAE